jgi:hypothetical protein
MPLWVTTVIAKANDFSSKDLQLISARGFNTPPPKKIQPHDEGLLSEKTVITTLHSPWPTHMHIP